MMDPGSRRTTGPDRRVLIGFVVVLAVAWLVAYAVEILRPGWGIPVALVLTTFLIAFVAGGVTRRARSR